MSGSKQSGLSIVVNGGSTIMTIAGDNNTMGGAHAVGAKPTARSVKKPAPAVKPKPAAPASKPKPKPKK